MTDDTAIAEVSRRRPGRGRLLRILVWLIASFLLFGGFGYFAGPPIARSALVELLSEQLHRPVSIGTIAVNPYALTVRINDLDVRDLDGESLAGFGELFLNVELASLVRGGPVVEEFRLLTSHARLVREKTGRYNISDLLDEWLKPGDSPPARFSINNIQVEGGHFEFDDRAVGKKHRVTDLRLDLPFVSNLPYQADIFVQPAFSATIDGAPLALAGSSKPFSQTRESELDVDLRGVVLPSYVGYLPIALPFTLMSGVADITLQFRFRSEPERGGVVELAGRANFRDLILTQTDGAPLVALSRLELPLARAEPLNQQFELGRITADGLRVTASVAADGTLDWLSLADRLAGAIPAGDKASTTPARPMLWSLAGGELTDGRLDWTDQSRGHPLKATARFSFSAGGVDSSLKKPLAVDVMAALDASPHATIDRIAAKSVMIDIANRKVNVADATVDGPRAVLGRQTDGTLTGPLPPLLKAGPAKPDPGNDEPPWTIAVENAVLDGGSFRFDDRLLTPMQSQVIDNLRLTVNKFTTAPKSPAQVSLNARINRKGTVATTGSVQLEPVVAHVNLDLRGIEILPLQPYFGDRLNLAITRGQLSAKGRADVAATPGKPFAATYRGQLTVGDFHSVDRASGADFLSWKSFHLGGIDVATEPLAIAVGEVALADFYARLIVSPEGKLNLMQTVRAEAEPTAKPPAKVPPAPETVPAGSAAHPAPPVRIDKVTLQGGTVSFTDHFIKPNYSANLGEIGGRISGLSSAPDSSADLDLRGAYDGAPVSIEGKVNPLASTPTLDVKAEVRGVELTPFSPYSGKYAGYAIDKGKLSLFVTYKIENGKLAAENRVFLDQLTFGDRIESPDATKLPVSLAVALLKNRRGEIDINLPIAGTLNDPEFSVGGIVVKVIVNLLTKAVTAPFALLGSLFGGGEELSHVDFADGRAALSPAAVKRLEALAKALDDRPGLRLEITGRVDVDKDREGLRRVVLERKIKARKLEQLVKQGTEAPPLDGIVIGDSEYLPLLQQAYQLEKFPKPRNWIGMAKDLPREEMEKLMLANALAGDDELRELANSRARGVADWLSGPGKIARERIFLLAPKLTGDERETKDVPLSRSDFSLK